MTLQFARVKEEEHHTRQHAATHCNERNTLQQPTSRVWTLQLDEFARVNEEDVCYSEAQRRLVKERKVCVCVYACVCVHVCVCVYMRVCVCILTRQQSQQTRYLRA